jgi:hypothetical protein
MRARPRPCSGRGTAMRPGQRRVSARLSTRSMLLCPLPRRRSTSAPFAASRGRFATTVRRVPRGSGEPRVRCRGSDRPGRRNVSAYLSECGRYRYSLTRDVAPLTGEGTCTFVMLNPSSADAEKAERVAEVMGWPIRPRICLGLTKDGAPRHPLYVRADARLVGFRVSA